MNNIEKYELRGFMLSKAVYKGSFEPLRSVAFIAKKHAFDEKEKIFEINIQINLKFGEETSMFEFLSAYKVNDLEWLEVMAEQTVINEFFRSIYPFLREKIYAYTSGSRPGILLPVADLKNADVTVGTGFTSHSPNNLKN